MRIKPNTVIVSIVVLTDKAMNSLGKYLRQAKILNSVSVGLAHNPLGYIKRRKQ